MADNGRGEATTKHAGLAAVSPVRAALWMALVGFVLALPTLGTGLHSLDDPMQRLLIDSHLRGQSPPGHAFWDLYTLANGRPEEMGPAIFEWARPWWTLPTLEIRFFRPVAVLTLYADALLFGDRYWLAHLHSALWYGLTCFLVTLVLLRLTEDRVAALLAAALFVGDDAHATAVTWFAGRNALIAACLFAAALLAFDRAAQRGRRRWLVAAAASFTLALLSAENVLSAAPAFACYAWFIDRRAARARWMSLAAVAGPTLIWLWFYRKCGFGSFGSGSYIDPFRDGIGFWSELATRYLALVRMQLRAPWTLASWLPAQLYAALDDVVPWLVGLALVMFCGRQLARNRDVQFWAVTTTFGLLPLAAAEPQDRLLTYAGIGFWALIALGTRSWLSWMRHTSTEPFARTLAAAAVVLPAVSYGAVSPFALMFGEAVRNTLVFEGPLLNTDPNLAQRALIVVHAPTLLLPLELIAERLRQGLPIPQRVATLGSSEAPVECTTLDPHSFELYAHDGYLRDPWARFWRGPSAPLTAGFEVRVRDYTARVVEVTHDGRPKRVRYHFDKPLADPSFRFVYWDRRTLRDFALPPVTQSSAIPAMPEGTWPK